MNEAELEERVAEILHYPVQGWLPEAAIASLSVWLLRRRGILPEKSPRTD